MPAHVQVQTALGAVLRDEAAREQPCGVFGSFGWSGEAVDEMEGRLKVLRGSSQPLNSAAPRARPLPDLLRPVRSLVGRRRSGGGARAQDAGFRFAFDAVRVKFKPSARDMQARRPPASPSALVRDVNAALHRASSRFSVIPPRSCLPGSACRSVRAAQVNVARRLTAPCSWLGMWRAGAPA